MIVQFFLEIVFGLLATFINFFPALVIPTDLLGSLAGFIELLAITSFFMPIGIFQLCLIIFIAFHGMEFIISVVNWIIGKIPTIT